MGEKTLKKRVVTPAMLLVTIGVVYGDIGTSPMYVLKSIIENNGGLQTVNRAFIIGSLSLIIWTVTLITTVKYVVVAMKADNNGEGGIFALYSLVKNYGKYLVIPAMLGGAALLADGVLTPAVTITTAIEGLHSISVFDQLLNNDQNRVILITLIIISVLFACQKAGTSLLGKAFGPIMLVWFLFLGITGVAHISGNLYILQALNPIYAVRILFSPYNKAGFMILGSVFLATTGAEALYSDMGHVGKQNIYTSWPFIKVCLLLNYMGQGAWILSNKDNTALQAMDGMNPFFQMLPPQMRPFAVILSTVAAIIASQALITGSFSLVSEAIRLDLMPHMQITYPSQTKGQLYIPLVNSVMWVGCCAVVLLFRTAAHMEAAYGLSITVTMLMTTFLLTVYLFKRKKRRIAAVVIGLVFAFIELFFFVSSLTKFFKGGYFAVLIAAALFVVMLSWYLGTQVERMQGVPLKMRQYLPILQALRQDASVPQICENLVYITNNSDPEYMDRDILYSILDKGPKRASAYWFIHIQVTDEPFTSDYTVESYGTDYVFFVTIRLGFKVPQRVNVYLRQIISDLVATGALPQQVRKYSIYKNATTGSFRFYHIRKTLAPESDISHLQKLAVRLKYKIRKMAGSPDKWYGLENSNLVIEYVPLFIRSKHFNPFVKTK